MTDLFADVQRIATGHPQASNEKLAYILTPDTATYETISDLNHNPSDQGWVRRLADRLLTGEPTDEFNIGTYRMDPGMNHPLHLHTASAEFYYVLSGQAQFTVGDADLSAGPGTAMYIPSGMPHAIAAADGSMELLYVFSNPDLTGIATRWL